MSIFSMQLIIMAGDILSYLIGHQRCDYLKEQSSPKSQEWRLDYYDQD